MTIDVSICNEPLVTVLMPVLNSASTLGEAINSIIRQTYTNWELVILDDGSHDNSVVIAKGFDDRRIKILADGSHLGLPAQLNRGVLLSRGQYIARMDADDLSYPERFARQVSYLVRNPEVDLLSTAVLVFESGGTVRGIRQGPERHADVCAHSWLKLTMQHPTWMGKSQWFRQNPYSLRAHRMEDYELLIRTQNNSVFACLPEVLLAYREDNLSFRRNFIARRNICKLFIERAITQRQIRIGMLGILAQLAKTCLDAIAFSTGLQDRLLRYRARQVRQEVVASWHAACSALRDI